ncbi:MAG: hypothetical protein M1538_00220 [Candidatus Marsarchaeota archaeon]|nr:hypothetical protein [Candidatus Marsarchaeota archaeon]
MINTKSSVKKNLKAFDGMPNEENLKEIIKDVNKDNKKDIKNFILDAADKIQYTFTQSQRDKGLTYNLNGRAINYSPISVDAGKHTKFGSVIISSITTILETGFDYSSNKDYIDSIFDIVENLISAGVEKVDLEKDYYDKTFGDKSKQNESKKSIIKGINDYLQAKKMELDANSNQAVDDYINSINEKFININKNSYIDNLRRENPYCYNDNKKEENKQNTNPKKYSIFEVKKAEFTDKHFL